MRLIREHLPLLVSVVVLWAVVGISLMVSIRENQGHIIYALDDTYIHMAMAKNFSQHGVWGVTKYGFTSSSSSPLWTLLLSLSYFLFGVNEISPLVLNLAIGTSICVLVYVFLRRYKTPPVFSVAVLLSIVFFVPLTTLIFFGQEHTLHVLLAIVFVYISSDALTKEKSTRSEMVLLLALAALLATVRYEGMFALIIVAFLFVVRRKVFYGFSLAAVGTLPIVVVGLVSVSKGWYFFPTSVLLKSNKPTLSSLDDLVRFLSRASHQIVGNPILLVLAIEAFVLLCINYGRRKTLRENSTVMIIIFIAATLLHMLLTTAAIYGHRYGAYLVGLGVFVIGVSVWKYLPEESKTKKKSVAKHEVKSGYDKYVALACFVALVALPLTEKSINLLPWTPLATKNIYEQQYQMGLFLRKFYQGKAIIANDIGAINYLADIRSLDIWGIGSLEVARLRIEKGDYGPRSIHELAKQKSVSIAIVYDHWFRLADGKSGIPQSWTKVGEWQIVNNVVCGGDKVSFYAVDPLQLGNLNNALKAFSSYLPQDVIQRFYRKDGEWENESR